MGADSRSALAHILYANVKAALLKMGVPAKCAQSLEGEYLDIMIEAGCERQAVSNRPRGRGQASCQSPSW